MATTLRKMMPAAPDVGEVTAATGDEQRSRR
jgi:hypothetical protein